MPLAAITCSTIILFSLPSWLSSPRTRSHSSTFCTNNSSNPRRFSSSCSGSHLHIHTIILFSSSSLPTNATFFPFPAFLLDIFHSVFFTPFRVEHLLLPHLHLGESWISVSVFQGFKNSSFPFSKSTLTLQSIRKSLPIMASWFNPLTTKSLWYRFTLFITKGRITSPFTLVWRVHLKSIRLMSFLIHNCVWDLFFP